jgi:NAD(P)-dependent dehydrogenase (short-subunit alcohol dehydrogenase family)
MKTVVVTGATSGIGLAVCAELLKNGYGVIGIGHCEKNCASAREKLLAALPGGEITFYWAELMHQQEVRAVAERIRGELETRCGGALYALVLNAGCVRSWYMTTPEGYEHQFALNHLSGFLLAHELLPNLMKGGGRVLLTSSGSHKMTKIKWDDIMFERRYRPLMAYKQSKLSNMLLALALNDRYTAKGVRAYGVAPGLVRTDIGNKKTGGLVDFVWKRRKKHGVDPSVPAAIYAGLLERGTTGGGLYFGLRGAARCSREVNRKNADRLFELSEKLCKIRFGVYDECMS